MKLLALVIFSVILVVMLGIAFIRMLGRTKKTDSRINGGSRVSKTKSPKSNGIIKTGTYLKMYYMFTESKFTRSEFRKITQQVSLLSVYDIQELRVKSTQFFIISVVYVLLLAFGSFVVYREAYPVMLITLFGIVSRDTIISKQLDKINHKLLSALSMSFSLVSQNYKRYNSIPDAIEKSELPKIVEPIFSEIYMILTAADAMERLEAFLSSTPFVLVQTFTCAAYTLSEAGDTRDERGNSVFIKSMQMLSAEVNASLFKISLINSKFGKTYLLPLAPLFLMGTIEGYCKSTIPSTSTVFNGTYGYMSKLIVILISMFGYYTISKMNETLVIRRVDVYTFIIKLLNKKWFANIVEDLKPKTNRKIYRKTMSLNGAMSQKTLDHLYAEKLVFFILILSMSLSIFIFGSVASRRALYYNVTGSGQENLTRDQYDRLFAMDTTYLKNTKIPSVVETTTLVKSSFPRLKKNEIDDQVSRLMSKYTAYHNATFKWWMIIVSYLFSIVGWFLPELMLMTRSKHVKEEAEEDVLQMQTLMSILMYSNIDTLEALYWLGKQSRVFKDTILKAYHSYPSNPEGSIDDLRISSQIPEFQRLCDKLALTISEISMEDAFSDVATEKEFMLSMRQMETTTKINNKRIAAGWIVMTSAFMLIVLEFLIPLGIASIGDLLNSMQTLKSAGM